MVINYLDKNVMTVGLFYSSMPICHLNNVLENLLITSIILGPKAPKDFNSFMKPIVNEICLLEGKLIYKK
jgi:hypothetical protein